MRFINGGEPTPRDEIELKLRRLISDCDLFPGFGRWAAIEKAIGEFIGWFALRIDPEGPCDEPELGYRLRKAAWGRGHATEGSRALVDKAFAELSASRVFANTMTVNSGSRRVMEKAGMKLVRTFFLEWPDVIDVLRTVDVEYELTGADWDRLQR